MRRFFKIKELSNEALKLDFVRDVLTLGSGVLISQLISVVTAPVLTRLFIPENFGYLALFLSFKDTLMAISSLCYEKAIVLPKKDSDALNLLGLSLSVALLFSLLCLFVVLCWGNSIAGLFDSSGTALWLVLLPVAVFLGSFVKVFNYWLTRERLYRVHATANILEMAFGVLLKMAAGFFIGATTGGLIGGTILGVFVAVIYLSWKIKRLGLFSKFNQLSLGKLPKVASQHRKFAYYSTPSTFLFLMSQNIIIFLLGYYFSPAAVGLFFLGRRVLWLPMVIISQSVYKVFFQKASEQRAAGRDILKGFTRTTLGMAAIGILPFGLLTFLGTDVFAYIFGADWGEAGRYIQVLSPLFFFMFINGPSNVIYDVFQKQDIRLIYGLAFNACRLGAIPIGYYIFHEVIQCLAMYSLVSIAFITFHLLLAYKYVKKDSVKMSDQAFS